MNVIMNNLLINLVNIFPYVISCIPQWEFLEAKIASVAQSAD